MAVLSPLLDGGSSCVAPGPRFALGMVKASISCKTPNLTGLEKPKEPQLWISVETAMKSKRKSPNGTNRFEGTDPERAVGSQQRFCLIRGNFSPVPVPCNLNHPIRRESKPRAGKRSQFSFQGRKVGAAHAPARTHSAPSPASSPASNTPRMCQRTTKWQAKQE